MIVNQPWQYGMRCQTHTHGRPEERKRNRQYPSRAGSIELRHKRCEGNEQPRPIKNGMPIAEASQPLAYSGTKELLVRKRAGREERVRGGNDAEQQDQYPRQPLHRTLVLVDATRAAKTGLYGSTATARR